MIRSLCRRPAGSYAWLVLLFVTVALFAGCNHAPTEEDSVSEYFKTSKTKRVPVAKFAGHVSIDGQPPAQGAHLFVILNNPEHLEKPGKGFPKYVAKCDAEGNFAFTTYVTGDGVPQGKYLLTFVEFRASKRKEGRSMGGMRPGLQQGFGGPDELKNLYNDPEKNKGDQTFLVDLTESGRTNLDFNLAVAGKDGGPPSEYSVTTVSSSN
jgi:hypothetical protein